MKTRQAVLILVPLLIVAWIWYSSLSFVPVPWPDDSAFYFVGRELFKWPPRWVMLPQAPFEPTYRIFNYNTMPLYPVIVGLGRLIGIDGSHAIKVWPLAAYGLSGSLLSAWLWRAGLPFAAAGLLGLLVALDPGMRWAAVLVRPESLIGLVGVALVLGLTLGFPERFRARGLWNPVAGLLALGAYAHFNAVHLLFPVVLAYAFAPLELVAIGLRGLLYLTPWLVMVAFHPLLFAYQMRLQWTRLVYHNPWLDSPAQALHGIFQDMGSPEPWPAYLHWIAYVVWAGILAAFALGLAWPLVRALRRKPRATYLLPATGWIVGAMWLWESKPEVWFNYYVHLAVWTFAGVGLLGLWKLAPHRAKPGAAVLRLRRLRGAAVAAVLGAIAFSTAIFATVDVTQAARLEETRTWHWDVYRDWIGCIDRELMAADERLGHPRPFRVWDPTFPDATVELSRLHPDWEFSRTNDFWERADLAVEHGHDVEAVIINEMLEWPERTISAPQSEHPGVRSVWMNWRAYFLNRLEKEPGWKPHRYLCQRGRWESFIYEK